MRATRNFAKNEVILHLIEEARNAELCRDTTEIRRTLQPVWEDIEETPDFTAYDETLRAELFRVSGAFLSFYGNAKNLKDYQTRGKDLLTNAIDLFEANKLYEKAAEAKVMLAFCYWNAGEVEECEAILEMVEAEFGNNRFHPVYLQICINRLMTLFWQQQYKQALKLIGKIKPLMQYCTDERLQAMFHNQAGIVFRGSRQYEKAAFHLMEAIRVAERAGNLLFVAINFNNLAFLYKETREFERAFECIEESISRFREIGHQVLLAHALDTKALIYLDCKRAKKAIETVTEAINIFHRGEDFRGLVDALWTRCRILLSVGRTADALIVFAKLYTTARTSIGEKVAGHFAKKLDEEIYTVRNFTLLEEVDEFKKSRIRVAVIRANGKITEAAKILGIKHQTLSEILKKQFPELMTELPIQTRARRSDSFEFGKDKEETKDEIKNYQVSQLVLSNKDYSFNFYCKSEKFETFYFDKYVMQESYGIDFGAIVAVTPIYDGRIKENMSVLVSTDDGFLVDRIKYDSFLNGYFILDRKGTPVILDEASIIGEPSGFCLFSDAEKTYIEFSKLP